MVVGYSNEPVTYSISRLSPFDAEIRGTWGCLPELYPEILRAILEKKVSFADFVVERPMSTIREVFHAFRHEGSLVQRTVLVPDFQ